MFGWEGGPGGGFGFKHGTIYDCLRKAKIKYRLYAGGAFPQVAALKGVSITEIKDVSDHFVKDLESSKVDFQYAFIEPSYDVINDYRNGTSQHPLANVAHGEGLIKVTYEAIRNSPAWGKSLLIITWDEHGGFYDHADPGKPPQCWRRGTRRRDPSTIITALPLNTSGRASRRSWFLLSSPRISSIIESTITHPFRQR